MRAAVLARDHATVHVTDHATAVVMGHGAMIKLIYNNNEANL